MVLLTYLDHSSPCGRTFEVAEQLFSSELAATRKKELSQDPNITDLSLSIWKESRGYVPRSMRVQRRVYQPELQ